MMLSPWLQNIVVGGHPLHADNDVLTSVIRHHMTEYKMLLLMCFQVESVNYFLYYHNIQIVSLKWPDMKTFCIYDIICDTQLHFDILFISMLTKKLGRRVCLIVIGPLLWMSLLYNSTKIKM